ncbi:hypothetical protein HDV62DRAFT_295178 [Trichoderma sp. SZMC 28011]
MVLIYLLTVVFIPHIPVLFKTTDTLFFVCLSAGTEFYSLLLFSRCLFLITKSNISFYICYFRGHFYCVHSHAPCTLIQALLFGT